MGLLAQIDVGTGSPGMALMLLPRVVIGLPTVLNKNTDRSGQPV